MLKIDIEDELTLEEKVKKLEEEVLSIKDIIKSIKDKLSI